MRFLHIADLHIGKQLNDVSFLEGQRYILEQIIQMAERERVDAVLIAGDVYQKSSPQAEAMTLFNDFLTRLVGAGMKVFVISGNHDSDQRIAYFSALIRGAGVYVSERFEGTLQKASFDDEYGRINICLMPFLKPAHVRRFFPGEKITGYQDAVRLVLENSPVNTGERNILLCHQFITGAERSDSEDVTVGGLDNIDASLFDDFDYVALGHIHKPQRILRDTLRYAGSPLKYSFSEVDHKKSAALVDVQEKGDVHVKLLPLYPLRDMRKVEGLIAEILDMPYSEDYVAVTVHDEIVPPDAKLEITASVFPNMMKFTVENSKTKYSSDVLENDRVERKSVAELFCDFYRMQHNDVLPTEEQLKIFENVCRELEEDEG